uniref:Uncharacterized protein n=1 Tax=Rhizophora mucronata TaxID=61149 RepID=A0A2P2JYR2_RHIMU
MKNPQATQHTGNKRFIYLTKRKLDQLGFSKNESKSGSESLYWQHSFHKGLVILDGQQQKSQ